MLTLTRLDTKQLTPGTITLEWRLMSSSENFGDYRLYIYKSNARSINLSEYYLLTSSGINPGVTAFLEDDVTGLTSKFVDYYYKVLISGLSGQGSSISEPYGMTVQSDKYAREIERRRNLVLNLHSGQDYHLLKRKDFGTFCPDCYDAVLQRTTKSKCDTCYDTGYLGGYYSDIHVRGQLNERPTREVHQLFGQWQDQDGVLYIPGEPLVNAKDVIVDRLSRRWVVLNVGSASKALHSIGQILQIRQVEKEDIIYSYPISY